MVSPYSFVGMKEINPTTVGKMLPEKQFELAYRIIDKVCNYYGIKRERILNKHREQPYVQIRHICILLIREKTGMGYKNIGKVFKRDHSTIMTSIKSVTNISETDEHLSKCITTLRMII